MKLRITIKLIWITPLALYLGCCMWSCAKVEEIPVELQPGLTYPHTEFPMIEEIIEEGEEISLFREVYAKADLKGFMDSVRATASDTLTAFTLFVPRDAAWEKAGYRREEIQALSPGACRDLLLYLTVTGRYLPDPEVPAISGNSVLRPESPLLEREVPTQWGGIIMQRHEYLLYLGRADERVFINGQEAASMTSDILPASDGAVYLINTLPLKPTKSVYELLEEEESYSLYLSALRISNEIYQEYQVGIDPNSRAEELFGMTPEPLVNDLGQLSELLGNSNAGEFARNMYTLFVPDNEAFQKAGLHDEAAVENYIRRSYVTTPGYINQLKRRPRYTNMDSVLNCSFFSAYQMLEKWPAYNLERQSLNVNEQLVLTNDMIMNPIFRREGIRRSVSVEFFDWAYFDENTWDFTRTVRENNELTLHFHQEGDRIALRRNDTPNGRTAYIVLDHANTMAVNGVIHRIDNLLLPTP